MTEFFVPSCPKEQAEETYAQLAAFAGSSVLAPEQRVFAITFRHDSEDWTAQVGQKLHGTRTRRRQRAKRMVDVTEQLSDGATVLAIFSGVPWRVVTDGRPIGVTLSAWENPFLAGIPRTATRFEPANPAD